MMILFLPVLISFIIGAATLKYLAPKTSWTPILSFSLSLALGLAESALIIFMSFLFFGICSKLFVLTTHVLFVCLSWIMFRNPSKPYFSSWRISDTWTLLFFLCCAVFVFWKVRMLPYGGWDAWQVWNFKSRFLLLANNGQWKDIFAPDLWRNSPHYPLLLPLINVWIWLFADPANISIPATTAGLFSVLSMTLTFGSVEQATGQKRFAYIATLLLISNTNFMLYATTQYCDILIAVYLLGAFICSFIGIKDDNQKALLLAGVFSGILSFTKPEGYVLCAALLFWLSIILVTKTPRPRKTLQALWTGAVITAIPTIIFLIFLSPGNQTMAHNAFASLDFLRLKIILIAMLLDVIHSKWSWIWLILISGILLKAPDAFKKPLLPTALTLISYVLILILYYWINTYFEIMWWLSVSLSRILSTLLPAALFWSFSSVWSNKKGCLKN